MQKITRKNTAAFLLLILTLGAVFILPNDWFSRAQVLDDKGYNVKLQIINDSDNQTHDFIVKLAKTDAEKERGLMFVKYLPKNYGMIFEFPVEQMVNMWMKNTPISLDMLFIDSNDQILYIKHEAQPYSESTISSRYQISKVLEINGGLSDKLGIQVGNHVQYLKQNHLY